MRMGGPTSISRLTIPCSSRLPALASTPLLQIGPETWDARFRPIRAHSIRAVVTMTVRMNTRAEYFRRGRAFTLKGKAAGGEDIGGKCEKVLDASPCVGVNPCASKA